MWMQLNSAERSPPPPSSRVSQPQPPVNSKVRTRLPRLTQRHFLASNAKLGPLFPTQSQQREKKKFISSGEHEHHSHPHPELSNTDQTATPQQSTGHTLLPAFATALGPLNGLHTSVRVGSPGRMFLDPVSEPRADPPFVRSDHFAAPFPFP